MTELVDVEDWAHPKKCRGGGMVDTGNLKFLVSLRGRAGSSPAPGMDSFEAGLMRVRLILLLAKQSRSY